MRCSTSDCRRSATAGKACNGMDLFEFLTNTIGTTREQLESAVSFWTQMCIVGKYVIRSGWTFELTCFGADGRTTTTDAMVTAAQNTLIREVYSNRRIHAC